MDGYAAVVLAGGAGRRMGGADKPARPVGGRPMLLRVLDAVNGARPRIVVGALPATITLAAITDPFEPDQATAPTVPGAATFPAVPGPAAASAVPGAATPPAVPGPATAPAVPGPATVPAVPGRATAPAVPGPATAPAVPGPATAPAVPGPAAASAAPAAPAAASAAPAATVAAEPSTGTSPEARGSGPQGSGPASQPLPGDVLTTVEQPPGGGPVVAAAAGLALLDQTVSTVALLAADLPFLTPEAIRHLIATLDGAPAADGAIYVDADRRPQWLCGVWRHASLRRRLDEMGERLDGAPLRTLLMPLAVVQVTADAGTPPPFFDCDTDADVRRAEEWWDDAR